MQIRKAARLLVFLAALLPLGCDQTPTGVDDDIASFVGSQPLSEAQEPKLVFESSEWEIEVFWVSFGEARDCPSGCFYSKAYGLKFQDRIGWMGLDAYGRDDSVTTRVNYFDVQAGDSTLFENDVRNQLEAALDESDRSYADATYDHFLLMLAGDEETPSTTLLDLAELLEEAYRPELGSVLLENAVVRSNKPILEVLAGLSGQGGYETVRDRAQDLLDQLSDEES